MSDFRSYSGEEFFSAIFPKRSFLVENILREKDSLMVVGGPKTGKSILIFQLLCSLTSCHPFLDQHKVGRPCTVVYVQLEGEISDYQNRLHRMAHSLELNPSNLAYLYSAPINLLDKVKSNSLCTEVQRYFSALDVLILDPLYFTFRGSLSDDRVVRELLGNLRIIKDFLGCAVILVHHTKKASFSQETGLQIEEGIDASFGSVFFQAWPDHVMMLNVNKNSGLRSLTCGTQRSGEILASATLRLIQPDPLYFEITEAAQTALKPVELLEYLKKNGPSTYLEIQLGLGMAERTFYYSIKPLLVQKLVQKDTRFSPQKYLAV